MKINLEKEEIFYKGLYFTFFKVKKAIDPSRIVAYKIGRPKLNSDISISYRYAWDAVFMDLKKSGELAKVLDGILKSERIVTK